MMIVTRTRKPGYRIVQSGDDVNIVLECLERRETRSEPVIRAGFRRNPVALRNTVAVEPQYESRFDGRACASAAGPLRGISGSVAVEHARERRQTHPRNGAGEAD